MALPPYPNDYASAASKILTDITIHKRSTIDHDITPILYGDTIEGYLAMPEAQIIGNLTTAHTSLHTSLKGLQADAWHDEISLLKKIPPQYIDRGSEIFSFSQIFIFLMVKRIF